MKSMYVFEYNEQMKKYRKENNVQNKIENVGVKNDKQLKNKFPKFSVKISSKYSGIHEIIVSTRRLSDKTFQVVGGYGQLSYGKIVKI